ncbi:bZIP transcription factor [Streptomyces polyrhachis]|uniref:BZIP transcription factor n=1 Tax=Streptomyces polyrhachis TaxID=1282885 RepID=A0ABW2GFZ2_9ACTN
MAAAACGTMESLSAGQKLTGALDRLKAQQSLHVSLDLDASSGELIALSEEAGEPLDDRTARVLADLEVTYDVHADKPLGKLGEGDEVDTALSVATPETTFMEMRQVDGTSYLRYDMAALGDLMGEAPPTAGELPPEMDVFGDLFAGKWISVDPEAMAEDMGAPGLGGPFAGLGASPIDPAAGTELLADLKKALADTVVLKDAGGRLGVERITATAGSRRLVQALAKGVAPYLEELAGGAKEFPLPTTEDLKGVPDREVAVDFVLKHGGLHSVSTDLGVLAPEEGTHLELHADLGEGEEIEAPAGAKPFDLGAVMEKMAEETKVPGGLGDDMDLKGLDEFEGMDPEMLKDLEESDPELARELKELEQKNAELQEELAKLDPESSEQ